MKHTPGPWIVDDDGDIVLKRGASHKMVAVGSNWMPDGVPGSRIEWPNATDATLVCAAPDLLAWCEALWESMCEHEEVLSAVCDCGTNYFDPVDAHSASCPVATLFAVITRAGGVTEASNA